MNRFSVVRTSWVATVSGLVLLLLAGCAVQAGPGARQERPSAAELNKYYYIPGAGKSQFIFNQDRIACTYAIRPWSADAFRDCMLTRGNIAFAWSATKLPAELQDDRLACSRAIVHRLTDEREEEFHRCLEARGDIIPAGGEGAFVSRETMQRYLEPPTAPPATMCSNFARGDRNLLAQCMTSTRSYSERYCLEMTNRQAAAYTQCMAGRGFRVVGLPEETVAAEGPPASITSEAPQSVPRRGLSIGQEAVLAALRDDMINAAGHCGFELAVITVVFRERARPFQCFSGEVVVKDILRDRHPSAFEIRNAVCEDPRVLTRIPYVSEALADDVARMLLCRRP